MLEELMVLGTPGGGEALSCAALGARWGLSLSAAEAAELTAAQGEALRAEGRGAFSPGALTELVRAFAPSPYAERERWAALLRSLVYTLAESPETGTDLALRLRRGRAALRARRDAAETAWEALCIARPAARTVFLDETLRELGRFFRRYDVVDAADAVPCAIDYPLLTPLPEGLCGVSLVEAYLRRLGAEFRFLRRFSPAVCRVLYAAFLSGWCGLCFNLCEPVLANALALAALGAEQEALLLHPEQSEALASRLAAEGTGVLRGAFDALGIPERERDHFLPALESVVARLRAGAAVSGVFVTARE